VNLAQAAIPAFTVVISLVFAIQLLGRWQARRRSHELAWTLALIFYAVGALPEVVGTLNGWNQLDFRLYYLFGGILLVPWLALGTAELLLRHGSPALWTYRGFVALVTVVGVVASAAAALHTAYLGVTNVPDHSAMCCASGAHEGTANVLAVVAAAVGNLVGTVVLVAGAAWSAWRTRRAGLPTQLTLGNVLILVGAFEVAIIASLTRLGLYQPFYAGQAVGVAIIYAGFLVIGSAPAARPRPA
jgi:hypothetical protein